MAFSCALMAAAALLPSCLREDRLVTSGRSREEILSGEERYVPPEDSLGVPAPDTLLLVCGIEYPAGCDWRRDSCTEGRLVVMQRQCGKREGVIFREVLGIPAGGNAAAGMDADTHHLLDGDLYTERAFPAETVLARNGKRLFSFEGRYMLEGLFPSADGPLYTLWRERSGTGLVLMRDGERILSRDGAVPYGGFSAACRSGTGALYRDEGKLCFAFHAQAGGVRAHFVWIDGELTQVASDGSLDTVQDIVMADGHLCILGRRQGATVLIDAGVGFILSDADGGGWQDCYIARFRGERVVCGTVVSDRRILGGLCIWHSGSGTVERLYGGTGGHILNDGNGVRAFVYTDEGSVKLPKGYRFPATTLPGRYFLPVPGGCSAIGDEIALALSPLDELGNPIVWTGREIDTVRINGFLSGAEYIVRTR